MESRSVSVHLVEAIKAEAASRGQVRQLGDDFAASHSQQEIAVLAKEERSAALPELDLPTHYTTWAPDGPIGGDASPDESEREDRRLVQEVPDGG